MYTEYDAYVLNGKFIERPYGENYIYRFATLADD